MKMLTDPYTGETFNPRRSNQRFMTARNRIAYHNLKQNERKNSKSFIDAPLSKNHKILLEIIGDINKPLKFKKDFLAGKGYNFNVLTHYELLDGNYCPALYNFAFLDLFGNNSNEITIIRRK